MALIKNKETMLAIGMISLTLSIIFGRYSNENTLFTFLEGMFIGLSLILNLTFLLLYRKEQNKR